jgi:hypothetical protein
MGFAVGFVLKQSQFGTVELIGVSGHRSPCDGFFLRGAEHPRKIKAIAPRYLGQIRIGTLGQGVPEQAHLQKELCDPSLFQEDLSGGFLCNNQGSKEIQFSEGMYDIQLRDWSVFPFEIDRHYEKIYSGAKDKDYLDRMKGTLLELNTWYPIELSVAGAPTVYDCQKFQVEGFSFGVFMLFDFGQNGTGSGLVRFVYEEGWGPPPQELLIHRFGRLIGEIQARPKSDAPTP